MTLADFTRPELCLPALRETDAPGVLLQLCLALQRGGVVPDSLAFYDRVVHRHLVGESATRCGVAILADWWQQIPATACAVGRLASPIAWQREAAAVRLVFLVATPALETSGANLLATLVRLAHDETALAALARAADAASLHGALAAVPIDALPVAAAGDAHGLLPTVVHA